MITQAEYLAMQARLRIHSAVENLADADACDREGELHQAILDECARREWFVIHSRMDKRPTIGSAIPDFTIFRQGAKCFFVEAKAKNEKPSPDQLAIAAWLMRLGYKYFVVRSFERFMEIVRGLE